MIKEYTLPLKVNACQWTGENLGEIIDFVGKDIVDYKDKKLFMFNCGGAHYSKKIIPIGDYIVRDTDDVFYTYNRKDFEKQFKEFIVDKADIKEYKSNFKDLIEDKDSIGTPIYNFMTNPTIEDWNKSTAASEFNWPQKGYIDFNIPGDPEPSEETKKAFDDIYNKAKEYSKKDSEKYESSFKDLIESEKIYSEKRLKDMVNHPDHYQSSNGIECIDAIIAATENKKGDEAVMVGNVIKYLWRYEKKWNKIEDIKKAQFYLNKLIEIVEKN